MTEPEKISDGHKWQLLELFKEFFNEISLSKNHLVSIEKNIQEEIHAIFDKFKTSINSKHYNTEEELVNKIDGLEREINNKLRLLEDEIKPIKFWVNSVKWFFGILFGAVCVGVVGYVSKRV